MKFFAFVCSIISVFTLSSSALTPVSSYALINNGCYLYSDESATHALFSLPESYFVQVIEKKEEVYKVSYLDCDGYVKVEGVTIVDYIPLYKYPISLSCFLSNDGNTITLRSSPFVKDDNIITRINDGSEVKYYGIKKGESQIEKLGNEWFYIKDTDGNFGYVYNLYLTPPVIPQNDYTKSEKIESNISSSLSLSSLQSGIVIGTLSLLFVFLLFICLRPKSQRY